MKSHFVHVIYSAARELGIFLTLLSIAAVVTPLAHAQSAIWHVDTEHSTAHLFLGTGANKVEIGIAPVSGGIVDPTGSADPRVELNIEPDTYPGAEYSQISFKSKRSSVLDDGELAVVGDLSVTRIERSVTMNAGEDYYGPEYGEPVAHSFTREVTLLLPGAVLPATKDGVMQVTSATSVSREAFPQVVSALTPGNWPNSVVEDLNCSTAQPAGEGYFGADCTGTPIVTATNVAPTPAGGGEGYYGSAPAVTSDVREATIAFNLRLSQVTPASASVSAPTIASGK